MTREQLIAQIRQKGSFLCVGLDTDLEKVPERFLHTVDPIFAFNKHIIDITKEFAVAYKPNLAFYELHGSKGWDALKRTVDYIPDECFTIADAKRGDIGNTSTYYARTFFEDMGFDSVTVAPYMGADSVQPFTAFQDKWTILLALTSNAGASDFQLPNELYKDVLKVSQHWGSIDNMMYVVGATKAESLTEIRSIVPDHFLLVPGVGAQGGSLEEVARYGLNSDIGLLVNSSRGIIFADDPAAEAQKIAAQMKVVMEAAGIL